MSPAIRPTTRPATLADLPEVTAIQHAAIEAIRPDPYADAELAAWRSIPPDDLVALIASGRYRVAEEGGRLLGGAGWDEGADGGSATVRLVFVHPAAHGLGIGAALIAAIEREVTARGAVRLFVPAALNAIGFYERLGYRRLERRAIPVGPVMLPYQQMFKDAA
jgi:GNAT superfamily N-acetyltransferase